MESEEDIFEPECVLEESVNEVRATLDESAISTEKLQSSKINKQKKKKD